MITVKSPQTGAESPHIGQTLGSGESPEGRVRISMRLQKKVPSGRTDNRIYYFDKTPLSVEGHFTVA